MADDDSVQLQALIDRIRAGDPGARRELAERAYGRLRRLAAKVLGASFPAVRARHELDSDYIAFDRTDVSPLFLARVRSDPRLVPVYVGYNVLLRINYR